MNLEKFSFVVLIQVKQVKIVFRKKKLKFIFLFRSDGRLGMGKSRRTLPMFTCLPNVKRAAMVACSNTHTAILLDNGKLLTFGSGPAGQLGLGDDRLVAYEPTLVSGVLDNVEILDGWCCECVFEPCVILIIFFFLVACSNSHTLCYSENDVYSFGDNTLGQLGHVGVAKQTVPRVIGENNVSKNSPICHNPVYFFRLIAAFHGYNACLIAASVKHSIVIFGPRPRRRELQSNNEILQSLTFDHAFNGSGSSNGRVMNDLNGGAGRRLPRKGDKQVCRKYFFFFEN